MKIRDSICVQVPCEKGVRGSGLLVHQARRSISQIRIRLAKEQLAVHILKRGFIVPRSGSGHHDSRQAPSGPASGLVLLPLGSMAMVYGRLS